MTNNILRQAKLVRREIFDPANPLHLESFKIFLATGNWGAVQFQPEAPYTEVPMTVVMKYAQYTLNVTMESPVDRANRMMVSGVQPFPKTVTLVELAEQSKARMTVANALIFSGR
jgi:hypothetical protein